MIAATVVIIFDFVLIIFLLKLESTERANNGYKSKS